MKIVDLALDKFHLNQGFAYVEFNIADEAGNVIKHSK